MTFERNLFTTEIEIFWIHTALSFDECWEHCLGRFSNWGTITFDVEKKNIDTWLKFCIRTKSHYDIKRWSSIDHDESWCINAQIGTGNKYHGWSSDWTSVSSRWKFLLPCRHFLRFQKRLLVMEFDKYSSRGNGLNCGPEILAPEPVDPTTSWCSAVRRAPVSVHNHREKLDGKIPVVKPQSN